MISIVRALLVACMALSFAGCSTVTIRDKGTQKLASEPFYDKSQAFFFWGLAGEKHIDVKQICGDRTARQMQAQTTFLDGFLAFLTIGIYSPRTAKVWCGEKSST